MERTSSVPDPRPVNPDMFVLARESRGWSQAVVAGKAGVSQARLSKIEAGLLAVPEDLLRSLAAALDYPETFFRQADAVYGPSTSEFFHRKKQSASVKALDQLHAVMNIRRMHIARLLRAVDATAVSGIEHVDLDEYESPEEVARKVRAEWRLPAGPVKNLVRAIEEAGGVVIRFAFGTPKVDAVSTWIPGLPPLFFLNEEMPADRQRLSLAHELGHVVMHATIRPEMETEANRFAAELLMPQADIRSALHDPSLTRLASLKPFWRVSMGALLKRASDLGTVSPSRATSLWVQMSQKGYRKREPAELDFPREEPRAVRQLLEVHQKNLGYSLPDLARLLSMSLQEFEHYYQRGATTQTGRGLRLV